MTFHQPAHPLLDNTAEHPAQQSSFGQLERLSGRLTGAVRRLAPVLIGILTTPTGISLVLADAVTWGNAKSVQSSQSTHLHACESYKPVKFALSYSSVYSALISNSPTKEAHPMRVLFSTSILVFTLVCDASVAQVELFSDSVVTEPQIELTAQTVSGTMFGSGVTEDNIGTGVPADSPGLDHSPDFDDSPVVPEPSSLILLSAGLLFLFLRQHRLKRPLGSTSGAP